MTDFKIIDLTPETLGEYGVCGYKDAMLETAEKKFNIPTQLIDIKDYKMAQQTPSPFGTFCIILDGMVISHHPISNTRLENILKAKGEGRRAKGEGF